MKKFTNKRIVSLLLAVCMLVSLLPVGMLGASALDADTYNNGNSYYRYNYASVYLNQWYAPTDEQYKAAFTTIWNTASGHSLWNANRLAAVAGNGAPLPPDSDYATDPFLYLGSVDTGTVSLTRYYGGYSASGVPFQMKILLPSSDEYQGRLYLYNLAAGAASVDVYVAPADAENPMDAAYLLGSASGMNTATSQMEFFTTAESAYIEAGEKIVTLVPNGGHLYGTYFELLGSNAPEVITLTPDAEVLNADGQLEVPAGDENGVNISIAGYSNLYEEDLDMTDMDLTVASRVDCHADTITATYDAGVINVKASRLTADPVTSMTLLYTNYDGAAWVEIPVKVVPGANKILTLGHTGTTDNLMENIDGSIALTADIDGVSTAIEADDEIVVEVVDADGVATENVAVSVSDNGVITFNGSVAGDYIAKVTATVDGVTNTTAYEIPLTVGAVYYYYDFMSLGGSITTDSSGYRLGELINNYDDVWTGSNAGYIGTKTGAGWKPAAAYNSTDWLWTTSATAYGAYFVENGENGYASVKLYVPVAADYSIDFIYTLWASGGLLDVYLAPADAEDALVDDYKLTAEAINMKASTIGETSVNLGTKNLAAGEYVVVFRNPGASDGLGYFLKGLKLTVAGNTGATGGYINLDDQARIVAVGGKTTIAAQVLPDYAAEAIAWESADDSIATVENGVVTGVSTGITTITASLASGFTRTVKVLVGTPTYTYKIYEGLKQIMDANGRVNQYPLQSEYYTVQGYDKAYASGLKTDPWFIAGTENNDGNATTEYTMLFNWACYEGTQGVLTQNLAGDGAYVRYQIKVSEDGTYSLATKVDSNSIIYAPPVFHIAPVSAEDPMADAYKVGEINTRLNGAKVQYVCNPIALTAGDYYVTISKAAVSRLTTGQDWLTNHNLFLYKIANLSDVAVSTENGAQIRISGKQGLRFISTFDKTTVDASKVVEYGTVILPTSDLNTQRDLVIDAEYNGHKAAKVVAVNKRTETDTEATFTAVITDIATANYTRSYTARAYAILDDGSVVYGDTFAVRSIYEVAKNGVASGTATEAELEAFNAIISAVEG